MKQMKTFVSKIIEISSNKNEKFSNVKQLFKIIIINLLQIKFKSVIELNF